MAETLAHPRSALHRFVMGTGYRTAPSQTQTGMPPGVPYIIGNEAAERFSYYGMRSLLVVFMTQYMVTAAGVPDRMDNAEARGYYSLFLSAVYITPVLGALLSDGLLGKYRTILFLSVVYCFGHFALALDSTRLGLLIGLGLIALGSGGIKPCVSAHVGDQFGESNKHLITSVFGWFYFSINAGSFLSTLLCPWLLADPRFGPHWAFGVPGILMVVATIYFWAGRNKFVHVPPGRTGFVREFFVEGIGILGLPFIFLYKVGVALKKTILGDKSKNGDNTPAADPAELNPLSGRSFQEYFRTYGFGALGRLLVIYLFVAVFWSLYDQSSGAWTLQATKMDLNFLGFTLLPAQVHTINPILILLFIPLVNYILYPAISKVFPLTPLRKIGIGFFLTAISFVVIAYTQSLIDAGGRPTVWWQFLAYVFLTLGETMVSITGLEFSYTQAPNKMKSAVMALWLASVSLGNLFTTAVNRFIRNADGTVKMTDYQYYWFFAGVMFVAAVIFVFVARFYRGQTYIQHSEEGAPVKQPAATANSASGEA